MSEFQSNPVLVISNIDKGDKIFESDLGTWNVTRAIRDCKAGKHRQFGFLTDDLYEAIKNVEVDQQKVCRLSKKIIKDAPPIILIEMLGKVWVIDGHHRIHSNRRFGITRMFGYVITEEDSAPYIVYYNGERIAPWLKK